MAFNNKSYNTRKSGRYNTPGNFVSGDAPQPIPSYTSAQGNNNFAQTQQPPLPPPERSYTTYPQEKTQQQPPLPPPERSYTTYPQEQLYDSNTDVVMKSEDNGAAGAEEETSTKPAWMKGKLDGVKKISNKERRRRQNKHLRKLLSPKNALMTLNELMPGEQVLNNMKVEEAVPQYYGGPMKNCFLAEVNLQGHNYKGYGESKNAAKNTAAEQAIRDLLVKKLTTITQTPDEVSEGEEEEPFPMMQLASFALHKLFDDWHQGGVAIPSFKNHPSANNSGSESGPPPTPKPAKVPRPHSLPANAAQLHPATLLSYMRGGLEYRELGIEGVNPPNLTYTVGLDIDGTTYIGKAGSKKEARRQAAKAACEALYAVKFDATPSANIPQPAAK